MIPEIQRLHIAMVAWRDPLRVFEIKRTPTEPTVEELMADPIARLLMDSDNIKPEVVWAFIIDTRQKLKIAGGETTNDPRCENSPTSRARACPK